MVVWQHRVAMARALELRHVQSRKRARSVSEPQDTGLTTDATMTRLANLTLTLALFGPIACGDNGTVLGSAANGGAGGGGGSVNSAGNSSSGSAGTSAGTTASSGGSGAGTAGAGGSSAGIAGDGAGGGGAGDAGAGGGGPCGGATCGAGQICCGPPQCGFCIAEGSGAFCGFTCSTCTVVGDCKSVVQNVAARLAEAQACNPTSSGGLQCPAQVSDACGCDVAVVSQEGPATQCYLEAVAQLNSMPGCANCVPSPCPTPTGQCAGDGSGMGQCQ